MGERERRVGGFTHSHVKIKVHLKERRAMDERVAIRKRRKKEVERKKVNVGFVNFPNLFLLCVLCMGECVCVFVRDCK